jgi:hypothetical protein
MGKHRSVVFAPLRIRTFVANPCRLCADLDSYTNSECLLFAKQFRSARLVGAVVALVTMCFFGGPLLLLGVFFVQSLFPTKSDWADESTLRGCVVVIGAAAVFVVPAVWISLLPHCILLRRAVRQVMRGLTCRSCNYSLVGLPIVDGAIRCPECAEQLILAQHGINTDESGQVRIVPTVTQSRPASRQISRR